MVSSRRVAPTGGGPRCALNGFDKSIKLISLGFWAAFSGSWTPLRSCLSCVSRHNTTQLRSDITTCPPPSCPSATFASDVTAPPGGALLCQFAVFFFFAFSLLFFILSFYFFVFLLLVYACEHYTCCIMYNITYNVFNGQMEADHKM